MSVFQTNRKILDNEIITGEHLHKLSEKQGFWLTFNACLHHYAGDPQRYVCFQKRCQYPSPFECIPIKYEAESQLVAY